MAKKKKPVVSWRGDGDELVTASFSTIQRKPGCDPCEVLLHDVRNEDGIKNFFQDVHELYVKVLLNPFYTPNTPITSPSFHQRVTTLGRKYF